MMKKLRKIIERAARMSRPAMLILKACVIVSALCAAAALLTLVYAGDYAADTYRLYSAAAEISAMPRGILLIGVIGSACAEDLLS